MKFGNLLKKELRELITKQVIVSMVVMLVLLIGLGKVMGTTMDEAMNSGKKIKLCDMDNTEFTQSLIDVLESDENEIELVSLQSEDYAAEMARLELDGLVVIPSGFTDKVLVSKERASLTFIGVMKGSGLLNSLDGASGEEMVETIEGALTSEILLNTYGISEEEMGRILAPVKTDPVTVVNGKSANVNTGLLSALTMSQSFIIPIAIFLLVMMASQMIMTAISTEKIDKTLETLLSAPVSRISVLSAKMLAAVIVALLNAVVYMIGFSSYITGMMGGAVNEISGAVNDAVSNAGAEVSGEILSTAQAMVQLGLTMSPLNIALFGVQIFLTIMIALSISLILGAIATDAKSVQSLTLPIMLLLMIPYMITMFTDVNSLPMAAKVLVYAIPFTHTYTAVGNMMYGHTGILIFGIIYQLVFFVVCMFLAAKMFTTDKIFTMSASDFSRKKTPAAK